MESIRVGSVMVKQQPSPGMPVLSNRTLPPCCSASRLTRASILRGKVDKPGAQEYAQFAWGLPGAHKVC